MEYHKEIRKQKNANAEQTIVNIRILESLLVYQEDTLLHLQQNKQKDLAQLIYLISNTKTA